MILKVPGFIATPLKLSFNNLDEYAQAAWKTQVIVRRCAAHEAFFSDYSKGCQGLCNGLCINETPACTAVQNTVIHTLAKPDALLWEVWSVNTNQQPIDLVGILRLSELVPRCSAKAHYFFFDAKLHDKTALLAAWKAWAFAPDGAGLHRVTIEVPAYAKALGYHAYRHLGFGGPYKLGRFAVEGVMKDAIKWRDTWHDIYIMGCVNGT